MATIWRDTRGIATLQDCHLCIGGQAALILSAEHFMGPACRSSSGVTVLHTQTEASK